LFQKVFVDVHTRFSSSQTYNASALNFGKSPDNGRAYTAEAPHIFAQQLGLKSCFIPFKSPQSNGMSDAFVKTFKRDDVRVNPLPDAETVLSLIGDWIDDYNENRPHSGLKWKSPRAFIRAKTETA